MQNRKENKVCFIPLNKCSYEQCLNTIKDIFTTVMVNTILKIKSSKIAIEKEINIHIIEKYRVLNIRRNCRIAAENLRRKYRVGEVIVEPFVAALKTG